VPAEALAAPGAALLDVPTDPAGDLLAAKIAVHDDWGFAIAKMKETLTGPDDKG
jgi:hypothetical protein